MQNELTAERVERAIAIQQELMRDMRSDDVDEENRETAEEVAVIVETVVLPVLRAEQERQWISVKDRLPEHPPDTIDEKGRVCFSTTNYVLVTNGKNVFTAFFEHQGRQPGYFWYRDSLHELTDITHWMPLPSTEGIENES